MLSLQFNGRDLDSFLWQGQLQAQSIGPIPLRGRWDGERLRGEGWWPKQSLMVFQPLISKDLGIKLRTVRFMRKPHSLRRVNKGLLPVGIGW